MNSDCRPIYLKLDKYLHNLTHNLEASNKIIHIMIKTGTPILTFLTGILLYNKVLQNYKTNSSEELFVNKNDLKAFYIKNSILDKQFLVQTPVSENEINFTKPIKKNDRNLAVSPFFQNILSDPYILIITCCIISSKLYSDISFTNESWCEIININCLELNRIEREILEMLDYKIGTEGLDKIYAEVEEFLKNEGVFVEPILNARRSKSLIKKIFCMF